MKIQAYTINAFAKTEEGGNPAGVVLNADKLTEKEMKKIAQIIGFSETAFVMQSDNADFKVRFFTPKEEVDLCGHATIATFTVLKKTNIITAGVYTQETKAGVLSVEVSDDDFVMMTQASPQFYEIIPYKEIAETLNVDVNAFDAILPCQIVSTGLKDIFIPIRSLQVLNAIEPDFEKIAALSEKYEVIGYHLFTLESQDEALASCRNFAPLYDIDEEAATGTSSGALSSYLFKYNKVSVEEASPIYLEQGYSINRPSEIRVNLNVKNDKIDEVKVGGKALKMETIEVVV